MTFRTLCALCLVAVAACNDKPPPPPQNGVKPAGDHEVTIRGKKIGVTPLVTYDQRQRALVDFSRFDKGNGLLLAHARDRIIHLYFFEPKSATFRVDLIDSSGKIVETQMLSAGEKGITPEREAKFALITHPETLAGIGAQKGDEVTLSDGVKKLGAAEQPVLKINGVPIYVDLCHTYELRQRGLMWRTRMSKDDGMLFIYPDPDKRRFWMGKTFIPLSLAYIRADGTISQFHDMETYRDPAHPPEDYKAYPSNEEVQYVLEVNWGFFKDHKIREGMKVEFPQELRDYPPR